MGLKQMCANERCSNLVTPQVGPALCRTCLRDPAFDAEGNVIVLDATVDVDRANDDGSPERGRVVDGPDKEGIYRIDLGGNFPVQSAHYEFVVVDPSKDN